MILKQFNRSVIAIFCAVVSHAFCDFAQADDRVNPNRKTVGSFQITPEQRAAFERQTRVFEDYFRRAPTEPTDFDKLRKSSREWDSLIEEIRNRVPQRDQPPASTERKQETNLPFEPFKLPAAEPFDPATVDWKTWNSHLRPNERGSKASSPDKRIRLPQGLMNWPMPKSGSRSNSGENLQKFDFSQFLLPELDKPLALPR